MLVGVMYLLLDTGLLSLSQKGVKPYHRRGFEWSSNFDLSLFTSTFVAVECGAFRATTGTLNQSTQSVSAFHVSDFCVCFFFPPIFVLGGSDHRACRPCSHSRETNNYSFNVCGFFHLCAKMPIVQKAGPMRGGVACCLMVLFGYLWFDCERAARN